MARFRFRNLYYITHIDNLPSIVNRGILAHEIVERDHIPFTPLYDSQIVSNRKSIMTPDHRSLWEFANLYFQPRNAMLYRVVNEKGVEHIAIVAVRRDVLDRNDVYITTGNAAHSQSEILERNQGRKVISKMQDILENEWWNREDGSLRKMMAECLVPDQISPDLIEGIYVASDVVRDRVKSMLPSANVSVIPNPKMFFQPSLRRALTNQLSIAQGDMFFSRMQTLTISVNCVGVMGKGLASRAKYQFPDVYVFYQDLCANHTLQMGKPYVYKREATLDDELVEDPLYGANGSAETWFLLFPTKNHWRERSDIDGIEKGLIWLLNNYRNLGIASLAVPALGCGLGQLEWRDVGPLLCKYLSQMIIPVEIYPPTEKQIPNEQLSREFLLKRTV